MALFLGVDGGQSSTVALIANEAGQVLGAGKGGPCNHAAAAEGRAKFTRAMADCLGGACAQAGLAVEDVRFDAACLGFSGGTAGKEDFTRETIRSKAFKITHDAEIALSGATGGQPGIVVIAGTGSIAFAKNEAGITFRAGGWGYIFGDEGGAFDIVRQALRAALAMEEGWGRTTVLRERLAKSTGVADASELMHYWYHHFDRTRIAELALTVDLAAKDGDEAARAILATAGGQLAELARAAYGGLFRNREAVSVSYVGGVFESKALTQVFTQKVREGTGCEAAAPVYPPAAGALIEALRLSGRVMKISGIPLIKS